MLSNRSAGHKALGLWDLWQASRQRLPFFCGITFPVQLKDGGFRRCVLQICQMPQSCIQHGWEFWQRCKAWQWGRYQVWELWMRSTCQALWRLQVVLWWVKYFLSLQLKETKLTKWYLQQILLHGKVSSRTPNVNEERVSAGAELVRHDQTEAAIEALFHFVRGWQLKIW